MRTLRTIEETHLINPLWNVRFGTCPVGVSFGVMLKHAITDETVMNSAASANCRPGQDLATGSNDH